MRALIIIAALVGVASCSQSLGVENMKFACKIDDDCEMGWICDTTMHICALPDCDATTSCGSDGGSCD
jgi:hypothetical protein